MKPAPCSSKAAWPRRSGQFERALETAPSDAQALNVVALAALRNGNVPRARELLNRAVAAHPSDALSQHHLGRVCDASGDVQSALAAHARAVQLRPDFQVARLFYGLALYRAGEAADFFASAGASAESKHNRRDARVDAQTTPPALRPALEQAVSIFRTGRRQAIARVAGAVRKGTRSQLTLTRVERCVRIYLREEQPDYPDARQKPTFLYFPGLGARPYIDRSTLSWIPALEAQTEAIRSELMALLPNSAGRERVFTSEALERENLRGLDAPPSWTGYYFYRHGQRREDNCASCPDTARADRRATASPIARAQAGSALLRVHAGH